MPLAPQLGCSAARERSPCLPCLRSPPRRKGVADSRRPSPRSSTDRIVTVRGHALRACVSPIGDATSHPRRAPGGLIPTGAESSPPPMRWLLSHGSSARWEGARCRSTTQRWGRPIVIGPAMPFVTAADRNPDLATNSALDRCGPKADASVGARARLGSAKWPPLLGGKPTLRVPVELGGDKVLSNLRVDAIMTPRIVLKSRSHERSEGLGERQMIAEDL